MDNKERVTMWLQEAGCRNIRDGAGENLVSTCPFHEVKSGTQFSMSYKTGLYVCFSGGCGVTGNIVTFLVHALGWTWQKAIWAKEQFKWDLPEVNFDELAPYEKRRKKSKPTEIDEALLGLYDFCPRYMLRRGFAQYILRLWEIGFDSDERRVTIPVRSREGRLLGFSKRAIEKWQKPPYLHMHFSKGEVLYGECNLKRRKEVWVVEGQLDVLALAQLGDIPAVSIMGTRFSKTQVEMLSEYKKVVLCLDNPSIDVDGSRTTMKLGNELLVKMGQKAVFVKPYHPMLTEMEIKDPGDLVSKWAGLSNRLDTYYEYFLEEKVEPFSEWRWRGDIL